MPWNGFLLPPQLQRAWVSSPNGRPCWRLPSLGTLTAPVQGTLPSAGHRRASVTPKPRPGAGGPGWDGVGSQRDQETPTSGPTPTSPHTSTLVPDLWLGQGSRWAQRDTNAQGHISGSCCTSTPGQPTLCQLLTPLKTSPLVAGRGGVGGTQAVMPLLTCFLKELTPPLKRRPTYHQGIPGVPAVSLRGVRPTETEEAVPSALLGTAQGEAADYSKDQPSPARLSCLPGGTGGRGCPGNTEQGTRLLRPGGAGVPGSGRKQCPEEGRPRALMVCGRACQPVGRLAQSQDTEG